MDQKHDDIELLDDSIEGLNKVETLDLNEDYHFSNQDLNQAIMSDFVNEIDSLVVPETHKIEEIEQTLPNQMIEKMEEVEVLTPEETTISETESESVPIENHSIAMPEEVSELEQMVEPVKPSEVKKNIKVDNHGAFVFMGILLGIFLVAIFFFPFIIKWIGI